MRVVLNLVGVVPNVELVDGEIVRIKDSNVVEGKMRSAYARFFEIPSLPPVGAILYTEGGDLRVEQVRYTERLAHYILDCKILFSFDPTPWEKVSASILLDNENH